MNKQIDELMSLVTDYATTYHGFANGVFHATECISQEAAIYSKLQETIPQWQPIDTAPKDGTMVMLGREESEDQAAISLPGYWLEGMSDAPDEMGFDAGFTDVNFQVFRGGRSWGVESYRYPAFQPTRWMPFPKAPE